MFVFISVSWSLSECMLWSYACTHAHTHAHTHTNARTHTHKRTHERTHTPLQHTSGDKADGCPYKGTGQAKSCINQSLGVCVRAGWGLGLKVGGGTWLHLRPTDPMGTMHPPSFMKQREKEMAPGGRPTQCNKT